MSTRTLFKTQSLFTYHTLSNQILFSLDTILKKADSWSIYLPAHSWPLHPQEETKSGKSKLIELATERNHRKIFLL